MNIFMHGKRFFTFLSRVFDLNEFFCSGIEVTHSCSYCGLLLV